jgi:lipopolysaccharide/colanic/teichoic acid biosynthesis glycosyltransferase
MAHIAVKLVPSKVKGVTNESGERQWSGKVSAAGLEDRLLSETEFLRTLGLERKRAERSRKSFVLALLDLEELRRSSNGSTLVGKTVSDISSSIRETDIPGWFRQNSVLGILFAELGAAARNSVLAALNTKINSALSSALPPQYMDQVRLSFYWFPEDWNDQDRRSGKVFTLYPELAEREKSRKIASIVKRAMDIAGSSFGLILLSPVFLATALAIKLSSPGPVFFRQERVGQYGRVFTFLKFRSMHCLNNPQIHMDYVKQFIAGKADSPASRPGESTVYKITQDPRVTRVGTFLRKTSIDELPQLFNVLQGEMSLVGPRPPLAYELEVYDVWHRRRLLEAKPGITGLWQVNGRSRLRFDDMVRLDLRYARTWSVWLDIKILLRTPRAVFSGEGAY